MLNVRGNYLFENDKPFFWLGDTAWLLAENMEIKDIIKYLKNRKSLGFNVIQMVLFYTMPNIDEIEGAMPVGGKSIYSKEYFNFVNEIFKISKSLGIYVALLPTWGSFVKNKIVDVGDVDKFSRFLVNTFALNENLIWVLGGDVKGDDNLDYFNSLGNALKTLDNKHLITFHPFGRTLSARWFNNQKWLDFNMFQSGHRRYDQARLKSWDDVSEVYYGEDAWRYVEENFSYDIKKPCLDAEPSYEGVVQGLHDPMEPYWEACDVRRYAYWSVFEGACGFTYGNNAIIQFYEKKLGKGAYGVRESWLEALHSEGGAELQYLKKLFESVDFTAGKNRNDLLLSPQKERYHRVSIFAGKDYLFAYNYMGDEYTISLKEYKNIEMNAYWMNPQNGSLSYIDTYINLDEITVRPTKRHELSNDWFLVLKK